MLYTANMVMNKSVDNTLSQMRKGTLELAILLVIADKPVYTSDILQRLKEAKLIVVEGTVYPLLNRLQREGTITYKWSESPNGPPRKYYTLTAQGSSVLVELKKSWQALTKSLNSLIQ